MSQTSAHGPDSGDTTLNLDRQLCFALYATSRAMTKAYQPMLRTLGITYPQYLVLLVLWQWDSEQRDCDLCSVSALGEQLMLDSGTLTPLLKRMEQQGHVSRRRGILDERVTLVQLTDSGRSLRARASSWRSSALESLAVPQHRLADLRKELWFLLDHLQSPPSK